MTDPAQRLLFGRPDRQTPQDLHREACRQILARPRDARGPALLLNAICAAGPAPPELLLLAAMCAPGAEGPLRDLERVYGEDVPATLARVVDQMRRDDEERGTP